MTVCGPTVLHWTARLPRLAQVDQICPCPIVTAGRCSFLPTAMHRTRTYAPAHPVAALVIGGFDLRGGVLDVSSGAAPGWYRSIGSAERPVSPSSSRWTAS
jgi:hypothetical protein